MTAASAPPGNGPEAVRAPRWTRACMVLLLLGFAAAVLVDPTADPPFGASSLEGQLLLGARALVPSETVVLEEWSPLFVAPSQSAITGMVFRLGGVRSDLARWVVALVALVLVAVFHEVVRRSLGPRRALLAMLFLTVNPAFFAAVRGGSPAIFSLLWMLLAVRLSSGPPGAGKGWLTFIAGGVTAWAALVENLPANFFFLGAALVWSLLVRLHAWKMPWVSSTRRRLAAFWAGAGAVAAVYLVVVTLHAGQALPTWNHFIKISPRLFASNIIQAPVHLTELFRLMPVVTVVVLLFFLFYGKAVFGPVARHRRLDEVRIWLFAWLVTAYVYFTVMGSRQLETLLLLVLPMCVLAAEGLSHVYRLRAIARPRLDVMIVVLLIAGFAWFASCWLVNRYYPGGGGGFWDTHRIRGSYLLIAVIWPASAGFLIWLYLKWKQQEIRLAPPLVVVATAGIAAGSLIPGGANAVAWWTTRTHQVDRAREVLADLPPGSLVVGSWAPLLTLGTPAGAAVVWPGLNDADAPWQDRVTHLLLREWEGPSGHPVSRIFARNSRAVLPPAALVTLGDHRLELIPLGPPPPDPDSGTGGR